MLAPIVGQKEITHQALALGRLSILPGIRKPEVREGEVDNLVVLAVPEPVVTVPWRPAEPRRAAGRVNGLNLLLNLFVVKMGVRERAVFKFSCWLEANGIIPGGDCNGDRKVVAARVVHEQERIRVTHIPTSDIVCMQRKRAIDVALE